MGALTPFPREVHAAFRARYAQDPAAATDWYYQLCQNTDYIRHYRIAKDMRCGRAWICQFQEHLLPGPESPPQPRHPGLGQVPQCP